MATRTWVEVWIDHAAQGDFIYVLILTPMDDSTFQIIDPQQGHQVAATFDHYAAAVHWLNEEEYAVVEGRYFFVA